MANNQSNDLAKRIIGKTLAGLVCQNYYQLNEVIVIIDAQHQAKALKLSSLSENAEAYSMDGEEVQEVRVAHSGKMFLFVTKSKQYLVNEENKIVEDSTNWEDSYFEPLSNSFYRKDKHDRWCDLEGFVMTETVFLKNDVLTSLETKSSKQSLSFLNQELFISENRQLIQIGKIVLDLNLESVNYLGERVTGLGKAHISFDGKDVVQEVRLSMDKTAFINEYTHEPYMFGEDRIIGYSGFHQYGQKRVDVFQTEADKSLGVEGRSHHFLTYQDKPLLIEGDRQLNFNETELIKVNDGIKSFYFNLNENIPFVIPGLEGVVLTDIDKNYVRVGNTKILNVTSPSDQFVVQELDGKIFKLDEGTVKPERVEDVESLAKYYGFATVDGEKKLFSKKQAKILKFGKDDLEVSEIVYNNSEKLVNAIDTSGNRLVLDLRQGFDKIALAKTDGDKILEAYGEAFEMAGRTLQNVFVETMGGKRRRVIDIGDQKLSCFALPEDLSQISMQDMTSVFAGNLFCEIEFQKERSIEGRTFLLADFVSFSGREYPIILEKESGKPLYLPGVGHKNELAIGWVDDTLRKAFYIGDNRMVGVKTLSENLKESTLLFSVQKLTSWLPFYDNYLPIFKQITEVKESEESSTETWDYHLFELAEITKDKEYVVVEKKPPYRILADKKSGVYRPRLVKSKQKTIKSPDELNKLIRFFIQDSEVLVEVE